MPTLQLLLRVWETLVNICLWLLDRIVLTPFVVTSICLISTRNATFEEKDNNKKSEQNKQEKIYASSATIIIFIRHDASFFIIT